MVMTDDRDKQLASNEMNTRWRYAGREPSLAALLDDPIAALLRRRDGLQRADVLRALATARRSTPRTRFGAARNPGASPAPVPWRHKWHE
ncbi:hypothetical protein CKO21_04930 [Rhodovibrio salinarum]|uniref:Uncharacterized protein n=1 Tax=Rhodovibrio salinarum TaxID=1087 RepID=A0A934QHG0_9PROT|nr:hypothetical protein [Rhodovibrio salinarum]